jgi:hypothetical protein
VSPEFSPDASSLLCLPVIQRNFRSQGTISVPQTEGRTKTCVIHDASALPISRQIHIICACISVSFPIMNTCIFSSDC